MGLNPLALLEGSWAPNSGLGFLFRGLGFYRQGVEALKIRAPEGHCGSCSDLVGALASASSVFSELIPKAHSDAGVHFI